jgi:hypoxanthine phosphoribosyltransferase
MAEVISRDYRDNDPLLVGILKGAFVFLADLVRHMNIPLQIDFIRVASYGDALESKGEITFTKDLEMSVEGRHLLVVEDIVDTGRTLKCLLEDLRQRGSSSVKTCVLLDKRHRREVDVPMDYVGFVMDEGFLVGYGLDWAETYRNLPDIYALDQG